MDNNDENKDKAVSWLASLLTGWGIKESWAQYIAAAVVGAVAAGAGDAACAGQRRDDQSRD